MVVSGEVGLRIIPESVTLKTGERIRFKVNAEGFGNAKIPVSWKVIPEKCGKIRKDGTFIAGEIPMKGRVIAVLPGRFGTGIVSADVYIVPDKIKPLELVPSFKHFIPEDSFILFALPHHECRKLKEWVENNEHVSVVPGASPRALEVYLLNETKLSKHREEKNKD